MAPTPPPAGAALSPLGSPTAQTPGLLYLQGEDNIRITSYNSLTSVKLTARARVLSLEDEIVPSEDTQTPNTDRTAKSSLILTPEGWLLGLDIFVSGAAPLVGQTFVVVEVVRGATTTALPLQMIASGYVTAKQPLAWPGMAVSQSLDGGGALRSIVGSTPAAGADLTEVVPTGARWELLAFRATLTTAVAAANRQPILILDDGVNAYFACGMTTAETASLTWTNVWAEGSPVLTVAAAVAALGNLPMGLRMGAGHRIVSVTVNIQAADQWSSPKYLVREWIEGA